MCVCGCHPIYSGHTGGKSHRISPPSFCGACLNFSREKDSVIPFPRRPCSRILCTNDLIVLGKYQSVRLHRDSNSRPSVRRFRGYQLNHRGDRCWYYGDVSTQFSLLTDLRNNELHYGTFNMPTSYQESAWEREAHINWSMVTYQGSTRSKLP